jgi:cytosine/adenosine deaminase-related metal-dependent hydrolase
MPRPLHIRHAVIWDEQDNNVIISRRDLSVGKQVTSRPVADAQQVDLDGYTIFPGFINAHDHLELNHYPRTKFRERYDNAHQWGEDVNARLNDSPFRELRAHSLDDRLFIGGLKNLLCGATTVAHHNLPHKALFRRDFPVRVVRRYGWAHSLHFSSDAEIRASYAATPQDAPWMIHLAEGTDATAQGEYARLKALGCVGANTVLIHGVGLSTEDLEHQPTALVWCPSSNLYLLGQTVAPSIFKRAWVVLGSDSRLTADGDLMDEMRIARQTYPTLDSIDLLYMVTTTPAAILRLKDAGHLRPGAQGDFIVVRGGASRRKVLEDAQRADLALVVRGGVPQIGDVDVMAKFVDVPTVPALLDGHEKEIHRALAQRLVRCKLQEPGLTVDGDALKPRRFWRA